MVNIHNFVSTTKSHSTYTLNWVDNKLNARSLFMYDGDFDVRKKCSVYFLCGYT